MEAVRAASVLVVYGGRKAHTWLFGIEIDAQCSSGEIGLIHSHQVSLVDRTCAMHVFMMGGFFLGVFKVEKNSR